MSAAEEKEAPAPRRAMGAIFLTIFIDLVGFSLIFPLFPAMLEYYLPRAGEGSLLAWLIDFLIAAAEGGPADPVFLATVLFGGILGSLYSLLQFLAAPLWGRLSDRYGRRGVLLVTVSLTALSYLLWMLAADFALLVLARLLGGLAAGNLAVATAAMADVTTSQQRTRGMALVGVAFGLGFLCGPALGGLAMQLPTLGASEAFVGFNPFSWPAVVALGLALLNLLWIWRRFPDVKPAPDPTRPRLGLREAWIPFLGIRPGHLRPLIGLYFLFIFAFSGIEFTLTFLAVERLALAPGGIALLFVYLGLILLLTQGGLVRSLSPRVDDAHLASAGIASVVVGILVMAWGPGWTGLLAGLALQAVGMGCASPALTSLVSRRAPVDAQGAALGHFRAAGSLARAIGPVVCALVYFEEGAPIAYTLAAFVAALSLGLLLQARRPPATDAAAPA